MFAGETHIGTDKSFSFSFNFFLLCLIILIHYILEFDSTGKRLALSLVVKKPSPDLDRIFFLIHIITGYFV